MEAPVSGACGGKQGVLEGLWAAHLPSLMASVCTCTVKSCQELSWNTEAWPQLWVRLLPSQADVKATGEPHGKWWHWAESPSPGLAAHLFVSCFDDECFCVRQAAWPEPQAHGPQGLPAEQQPRDPGQHPDHGVIADAPPWTATVAAEPLWTGRRWVRRSGGRGRGPGRTHLPTLPTYHG
jgi:hypothetical protein